MKKRFFQPGEYGKSKDRVPSKHDLCRYFELAALLIFIPTTALIIIFNPSPGVGIVEEVPSSEIVQAYAYAMPADGWAPLTVYFSAFGSTSTAGSIVKYEWDLDANGRYDTDATREGGYAKYIYKKSGEYRITLKVTDDKGNVAIDRVIVKVKYPASSSVDYWSIFDDSQVRRVDLFFTQANWDLIWRQPESKLRVQANMRIFGEQLNNVAVSMKGNASLTESGDKKSWKIDTDYFVPNQEFHNLKQLLFHNNFWDASLLREKMGYDMLDFAGVPTGKTAYVEIWIDIVDDNEPGEYWGIYTMVERVDSKFVRNRLGQAKGIGNLFKADAQPGEEADLAYYGPNIEDYPKPRGETAYHLQTNLVEADYSDIIHLCYVIDGVQYETAQDFADALEPIFNVDGYLRYLAVIFTNLNLDTYPYTGNNFYLYNNPSTGKFEILPWDNNNSWGHFGGEFDFPLYGESCCMGPLQWAPLFTHVFEVPQYRQDYAAYVDLLLRNWFNEQQIGRQTEKWHNLIGPYLTKATGDKMYVGTSALFTVEQFTQDRLQLVTLTGERSTFLQSVLSSGQWKTDVPVANIKPEDQEGLLP